MDREVWTYFCHMGYLGKSANLLLTHGTAICQSSTNWNDPIYSRAYGRRVAENVF